MEEKFRHKNKKITIKEMCRNNNLEKKNETIN